MMAASDRPVDARRHSVDGIVELAPLSLPDLLEQVVATSPDALLIDFFGRSFSYGEVAALSRRVATGLAELGIRPGDRVGLYLPNVPYYVAAYFGALRLGAVVVNLPLSSSAAELRRQAEEAGTRVVFTLAAAGLLPKAMGLLADGSLERLIVGSLTGCLSGGKALFQRLFGRGMLPMPQSGGRISSFDELIDNDGSVPRIGVDPERDTALIQYMAEDGEVMRGAEFTHQALTANARQMHLLCSENWPDTVERVVCALPLTDMVGQSCVLNRIIAKGGEMVMLSIARPVETVAAIRRARATCLPATPALLWALLDHPGLTRADFASLKACLLVGALSQPLRERFALFSDAQLIEVYALPGAGIVSCRLSDGRGKGGAISRPLPATHVGLAHRDDPARHPAPGEPAEIIVRGPQLLKGYWRDAVPPPFIMRGGQGWLPTGDVGTADSDGHVRLLDRDEDMISVTGFKVYPSRVEAILRRHPAIGQAVVAGVADHYAGKLPKAFVTLTKGAAATGPELRDWLNARVGKHEQLVAVEIRESLPRDPIGRLDRRALTSQEVSDRAVPRSGAA